MTDTEILKKYESNIRIIANQIAGKNTAIIDDLEQMGRIKLLKVWAKRDRINFEFWTYAQFSIKRYMRQSIAGVITVPDNRRKKVLVTTTLDENLACYDTDVTDAKALADVLASIEAEVETHVYAKQFKAYFKSLESGGSRTLYPKHYKALQELLQRHKAEALEVLKWT